MQHILSIAAHTLGCKVNQCDTDALLERLKNMGLAVRNFNQVSDIYIVNTCTVTHVSDKKSRQMISRARRLNPSAFVAVCGCMAKNSPEVSGVDFVFDARKPDDFFEKVRELLEQPIFAAPTDLCEHKSRTRAFIKIQDGCDRFCSYCIVPYVRGPMHSRPMADILADARESIKSGTMEIVLTGIQVASYGDDTDGNFTELIKNVAKLEGLKRLRLSSIDPTAIDDAFLGAVAASPAICDHFHLSLQSGCDATLARMNRRYTTSQYARAAKELRALKPDCALTTDIIVGFPGETDEDFHESLDFAKKMNFAQVHVFEFSPRAGTPAVSYSDQIPQKIKARRGILMRQLADNLRKNFLESQIGKTLPVLFETNSKGHTTNYCPVELAHGAAANSIREVKITGCTGTILAGK